MDTTSGDAEQFFEPLGRCRSFTWHGNLNEYTTNGSPQDASSSPIIIKNEVQNVANGRKENSLNLKKPSTRRNAWGCMSYADLITKAIESVPEKRLTLSQIYSWMIENVPYFKDKGESNSSAGWKNSIRHNLSLHRKFMRVQNEGTGKSSWWIVNNEAKTCKSPRRRAASMDNKTYEKKRNRHAAAVANNRTAGGYQQPNVAAVMPEPHKLDSFATAFSPIDLRSSGSKSHLSPIEPILESPFDEQIMTQPSPLYWNQIHNVNPTYAHPDGLTETVGESLAELFTPDVNTNYEPSYSPDHRLTVLQNLSSDKFTSDAGYLPFQELGVALPSPPPYAGQPVTNDVPFSRGSTTTLCSLQPPASNASNSYSGMQYLTRSNFALNLSTGDDVIAMQKYYVESNDEHFSNETGGNSVLRQMLMQKSGTSIQCGAGYGESVLEPDASGCIDAFNYSKGMPTLEALHANSSTVSYSTHDGEIHHMQAHYAAQDRDGDAAGEPVVKQEAHEESWEFSIGLVPPDSRAKDNEK